MPDKQVRAARCAAIVAVLMALWLGGRAWASTTATVTLGGAEQSGDSGNITLSFNGFSETVEYGQYSTSASIASAFGGMFSRDDLPSGLCANASGAVVTFTLQSGSFGTLNVTGSTASFQVNSSGFSSQTGGQAADSGTVTLTVGGVVAAQTNYGSESTQASVASGLAAGVTPGSYVSVTASGNALQLQSKQTGAGTNYSYTLATTSYDTAEFSQPSFMNPPASGSLSGGSNGGGGSPQTVYSYTGSYDHHSNVLSYNDAVMGAWSFGYDNLSRVLSGSPASGNSSNGGLNLCWSYDSFGNRTAQDSQSAACPALPTLPAATAHYNANNQVSWTQVNGADAGFTYDAAGNVTYDNVYQYLYDAEGRICAVENTAGPSPVMTGYLYDAEGNRIAKGTIQNMTSCDPAVNGFVASSEVDSIRDQNGQQMAEATINAGSGTMVSSHANVWAAGQLLATYAMNQTGTPLSFYFNDPLGTRRIETDYQGTILQNCSSLPFGDGETCLPTPTEHLFTQKERDAETGNDYFGARYYGSNMGRFLSPDWDSDPDPVPYADFTNPQSLNLYSYGGNNPLTSIDSDGHYHCDPDSSTTTTDSNGNTIVTVTAGACYDDWDDFIDLTQQIAKKTEDVLSTAGQQVADYLTAPRNMGCLNAATAAGATAGAGMGAGVGVFAGAGVFDEATVPAGAVTGFGVGGVAGFGMGMSACMTGAVGGGGGGGGGGGLSGRARNKLGNLANRAGEKVRDVIRSRGGSASNVNQAGPWADRTLGETAEAAARGDSSAETAIKIAKQAGRLGQQY